ncbi:MAG: Do family serine endopeptidase [Saprospiraceae bacterium]|nr:Do family serine endopeptidase [Saprospiraceae bacterium]
METKKISTVKKYLATAAVSVLSSLATISVYNMFSGQVESSLKDQAIVASDPVPVRAVARPLSPNITNVSSFKEAADLVRPAVVHIESSSSSRYDNFLDLGRGASSGSGVIMTKDGYIITNNHVIEDAKTIKVTMNDRRSYEAKIIGTDPSTDLAVIKIKDTELNDRELPTLEFGNSDEVNVGEWVLAVGNPFNLTSTVTAGIVSAKGRNIEILEDLYSIESFIQTDAAVNPGNSGGALVDTEGNLVGINTAIMTRSGRYEGYSFAVPANLVRKVMSDLIEFGEVQRGFLGVTIKDVTDEIAEELGLSSLDGVYLDQINSGSSAEKAGLESGDIILYVNDIKVQSSPELQEQIARYRPGNAIKLRVLRDSKEMEVEVVLRNKSNTTELSAKRFNSKDNILEDLGINARTVTDQENQENRKVGGIIITEITEGSLIEKTNMDINFIVTTVNNKKIKSLQEFEDAIFNATDEVILDGFYEEYPGDFSYVFQK